LTESRFKKKANAICRAGNREGDALDNKFFGNLGKNEAPDQATIDAFVVEFLLDDDAGRVLACRGAPFRQVAPR